MLQSADCIIINFKHCFLQNLFFHLMMYLFQSIKYVQIRRV